MSNKQVRVNLLFQADTSAALNNINSLGQTLSKIASTTKVGIDGGSLNAAVNSATQLAIQLQKAVNVDTGKLDLLKFSTNLNKAGQDVNSFAMGLQTVGTTGQQAFIKLATAVSQANAPMVSINSKLKDFTVSMMNTVKWQIASKMIHGLEGAIQGAFSHAENLNRALNDIRIVTGYSEETMASFAGRASQAAKELSTTTTEYAKAALIFYQQGLSGDAVEERANVVVKLAQVTGESAQMVSDQMTAIWNNFSEEGGPALEYYADVLTKLGAATAASTDEISAGLEKFAAVADTVGLSYETAAASVATVVDKTRQSAEVVGTSFKTIFARMQGLSLGETLEDGVDLNKYSEALKAVGVDVLDAKGELRDMDDILEDLGSKWKGFGEETQVAIAQTVGGIRQYNQMIALMDNWDSVKENIDLAKNATGELTKQQDIWAQSYEGAANRVKQAQNELYEQIITQDFLIGYKNIIADVIGGVGNLIESFGGVMPIVGMLIAIFSTKLFPMLQAGFLNLRNNLNVFTGKAAQDIANIQQSVSSRMGEMIKQSNAFTETERQQMEVTKSLVDAKRQLILTSKHMSAAEREEAESVMQTYEAIGNEIQRVLEKKAAIEEEIRVTKEKMNMGTAKKEVAEVAALNSFRKGFEGPPDDEDSIVDQATSTSMAATKKEINFLGSDEGKEATRLEIENKINQLKQANLTIEQQFDQLNSNETEKGEQLLKTLESQNAEIQELEDQLNHVDDINEERITHLKEVLALQQSIREETQKEGSELVVGEVSTAAFEDNKISRGEDVGALEQGMTDNVVSAMQGTVDNEGNVTIDASVANLEKLYGLMGQYKMQLEEIKALETDFSSDFIQQEIQAKDALIQAERELAAAKEEEAALDKTDEKNSAKRAAASEKVAKAQQKVNDALDRSKKVTEQSKKVGLDFTKAMTSLEKKMRELAKSAGASEDDLAALSKSFQELGQGNSSEAIENIKNKLKDLKIATGDTDNSLDLLAQSMREALAGSGMDGAQLDALINNLQELNLITPEVANKMRLFNQTADQLGGSAPSKGEAIVGKISSIASVAGQAAMTISMASSALQNLLNPDASPLEKVVSTLMALSMIIPIVTKAIQFQMAVKKAKLAVDASEGAMTAANIPKLLVEAGAISTNTAATWGNTIANLANLLSSPWTMALAAVAIAAIAGVVAWLGKKTEQTEADTKANIENAEASNEASNAWQEQSSEVDSLIAQYKDLAAAGKDLKDIQDDLKNSADDLTETYIEMANTFSNLSGKTFKDMQNNTITYAQAVQNLNDAMVSGNIEATEFYKDQLDSAITPEAADAAKQGATAAANNLANTLAKDGGASLNGTEVTRHVGGVGAEEYTAVDILSKHGLGTKTGRGNGIDISMDTADSGEFLKQYEELLAAQEEIEATLDPKDLKDSDTYREITEMINATEEQYEKLKEMQAEADKYGVIDVTQGFQEDNKTFASTGEEMDITNINSLEEYAEYRDAILNDPSIKNDAAAEQAALDWLAAQGHLAEYEDARAKIANASDVTGLSEDSLMGVYNSLSEEEKTLFMEVDFNEIDSIEELHAEIDRLQEEADTAEQIEIATTAEIDEDELESYIDLLKQTEEGAKLSESALTMIAVANKRLEKGTGTLAKDWADLNDVMTDSNASMTDLSKVMPTINDGLQDILNLSDEQFELLPPDFAQKNWDLIQDVMNGVDGAVEKLRSKAGEEILLTVDGVVDPNGNINQGIMDVHNAINNFDASQFEVGVAITGQQDFYDTCQAMINAAGMTAEQAQAYFGSMGYDVTFSDNPQTVQEQVTEYEYTYDYDDDGNPTYRHVTPVIKTVETTIDAPTIETITPNGSYGGSTLVEDSAPQSSVKEAKESGGGGGGSEKKEEEFEPAEKLKKEDVVERYKETEDAIDDVTDAYDDASKAADRLYGAGRIAMMAKANGQLLKEIGLLKQKKKQAQEYLKLDKVALDEAATSAGIQLQYDANGNIVNYTQELGRLVDEYNELVDAVNEDGQKTEEEVEQLEAKKKAIDDVTEALENYEGTREEIEDIENEMRDKFYEWQDNNFEMWSHSLEVSLDITDDAKQLLDALLARTEGDFYMQAEGLALMGAQFALTNVEMGTYIGHLGALGGLMATGSISPADFVEGLDQVQQGAMNAAQALYELHDKMVHYYGNALQMGLEEIDVYTDQLEHCTSVLEHYLSLLELTGQSTNYDAIGTVLAGQIETAANELDAAYDQYVWLAKEADEKYALYQASIFRSQAQVFEQQYKDAIEAATEAEEEFLSKAEAYAGILNAKLENDLAKFNQELEDALTGGTSFDQMTTKMEHMVSIQEEYLTTTNKIYETEKLMNQAQQEIDKTSNTIAKQRLKQFITETNQLKEKGQLSKFELDVQKAKYEILLAEIALEEAQNAKSQVRLQRDNAGNFGYVYTADSGAIADAQQELADKQNAFYNMALEGVNTYAEKYYETLEEMYTTLTEIDQQYREGAFASFTEYEEYRASVQKHYYDKLKQYSEIYNIAIQLDSDATRDSWGKDYASMIDSTEEWQKAVSTHTSQVKSSFETWTSRLTELAKLTGVSMDTLAQSVAKVTVKSDALKKKTDEVIDAVKEEMAMVSMLTAIYAALSGVVLALAAAYMALAMAIMFAKMAASMGSMVGAIDLSGASDVISQAGSALTDSAESSGGNAETSAASSGGSYKVGDTVKYTGGDYYHDSYGSSPSGHRGAGKEVTITHIVPGAEKPIHVKSDDSAYGWLTEDEIARLDSGGYTGAWGPYGKLAVLDEKELVLNADDTKNFLASMSLLDSIVSTIDLHAANHSIGGLLNSPRMGELENNTLEQTVTIEANFPSVSSRTEIEEAFSTIVNRASQYANRK